MSSLVTSVAISAIFFTEINVFLNFYLLSQIFIRKKIQKKPELSLIYCRFLIDVIYSFDTSIFLIYSLIKTLFPEFSVKNLAYFVAWPGFNLGTIRCWIVFFITSDRIFATCAPISYHNHRFKIPLAVIIILISAYTILEQYILFGYCDFVLDVPADCAIFRCAINICYHEYWKTFSQTMYFCIGTLTFILFFRLFIWNHFILRSTNTAISRATKITLLDSFIIFSFDLFPVFLTARFPDINSRTVGPLSALLKHMGFVIESLIICKVLRNSKQVVPASMSRTTPNNAPVMT
ncbi:Serpentine Receptor, class BC (Class B-like) [Caenorhabditis elegans]|uniref:Serpentine Receptor, class BC (Class B-like) n=1 Tax=Caenorhabditis elegans TaxID=6239 RepID=O16260_CAEEL|nr:Serpentine Receptor, class BC (Class B-like) [Caenorhabditis elegans]CCD63251.1 Serpentine Receptor, class BC (Class B-like) [Caenorhabditis elegans]|eukprot:NP_503323.1 Serpentine Receptor, class BC (class B-like) [Caenorhabditis elegans]